jgi:hypothetical protein
MIPSDSPVPCGNEVDLRLFVESDHTGKQFTRRSRTGFVIYLNMSSFESSPVIFPMGSHSNHGSSICGVVDGSCVLYGEIPEFSCYGAAPFLDCMA